MTEDIQQTALAEYKPVRLASNYRHGSIAPPFESALEMAVPPFESGKGWFTPKGNSKFTGARDGFIDFNFEKCTGGTKKWKFKYLFDESEYNKVGEKPPEWSRDNWKFNDTRPNNTASSLDDCGLNANTLFTNGRGGDGNKKFRPYTRKANNLSNRFMWGVMEDPQFAKNAYVTHNYNGKSHHTRASAITFRYHVHLYEDRSAIVIGQLNNEHGCNPIEAFCLAYVKKGDSKIYLAECIAVDKRQVTDDAPYPVRSGQWLGNNQMGSWCQSQTWNDRKVWHEHGPKNNDKWETEVDGVCTLTVSRAAAERIWDWKMVCVGFVATSVHSSRQAGYVGSSCWFDMWDVKLLEMEYRGQNSFSTAGGEEDPKFTRVLRPADTKRGNFDYYHAPDESPKYFTMDLVY